jgi:ribosomal protein L24E
MTNPQQAQRRCRFCGEPIYIGYTRITCRKCEHSLNIMYSRERRRKAREARQ